MGWTRGLAGCRCGCWVLLWYGRIGMGRYQSSNNKPPRVRGFLLRRTVQPKRGPSRCRETKEREKRFIFVVVILLPVLLASLVASLTPCEYHVSKPDNAARSLDLAPPRPSSSGHQQSAKMAHAMWGNKGSVNGGPTWWRPEKKNGRESFAKNGPVVQASASLAETLIHLSGTSHHPLARHVRGLANRDGDYRGVFWEIVGLIPVASSSCLFWPPRLCRLLLLIRRRRRRRRMTNLFRSSSSHQCRTQADFEISRHQLNHTVTRQSQR